MELTSLSLPGKLKNFNQPFFPTTHPLFPEKSHFINSLNGSGESWIKIVRGSDMSEK